VFEQFVKRPFHLALYRNGPYSVERGRSLAHFLEITSGLPTIRELEIPVERNLPWPIWHYFIGEKSVGRIYTTSIFSTSLVAGSEFSLINS